MATIHKIALVLAAGALLAVALGGAVWYTTTSNQVYTAVYSGMGAKYPGFGPIVKIKSYNSRPEDRTNFYVTWDKHTAVKIWDIREADVLAFSPSAPEVSTITTVFGHTKTSYTTASSTFGFIAGRLDDFTIGQDMVRLRFMKSPSGEAFSLPVDRKTFYRIFGKPDRISKGRRPWA